MQTVTLVIPCFNEARRLDLPQVEGFLGTHPGCRLVFVDDGSTDGTYEYLIPLRQNWSAQVELIRLEVNSGKGEAVRRGMLHALSGDAAFIGYWDADLATPLEAVVPMLEEFEHRSQCRILTGCRLLRLGADIRRSTLRHLIGRVFATAASLHLGLPVYDTQCGAKLFRREVVEELFSEPFVTRWLFDVEIFDRFRRIYGWEEARWNIVEFPLSQWRDVSGSSLKLTSAPGILLAFLRLRRHYRKKR